MVALPPNATGRIWFDYVDSGSIAIEHTMLMRFNGTDRDAVAEQTAFLAFLGAIGAGFLTVGWKVIRVRTALAGEDFSVPVTTLPALASFVGTGNYTYTKALMPRSFNWQGRSRVSKHRTAIQLFGVVAAQATPNNYRYTAGQVVNLTAGINWLNGSTNPFVGIDGTKPQWYNYVNVALNVYWTRRARIQ